MSTLLRERLASIDIPEGIGVYRNEGYDYLTSTGVTGADVPALVAMAKEWVEEPEEDCEAGEVWVPLHAWRTLSQLGDPAAIDGLIEILGKADGDALDYILEDFPYVFRGIGPAALPSLRAFLASDGGAWEPASEWPLVVAAHAISLIGDAHADHRDEAVEILAAKLRAYRENDLELNAFLVSYLGDLKAKECFDLVEEVYAAEAAELSVCGNFHDVEGIFGMQGSGRVPEEIATKDPMGDFRRRMGYRSITKQDDQAVRVARRAEREAQRTKKKKRKEAQARRKKNKRRG